MNRTTALTALTAAVERALEGRSSVRPESFRRL